MGELRGMDELWLTRSAYCSEGLMKLAKWIKKTLGFDSRQLYPTVHDVSICIGSCVFMPLSNLLVVYLHLQTFQWELFKILCV